MTKSKLIICSGDSYTAGDELAGDLFVEGYTSTLYPNNQKMTDERKKIIEKLQKKTLPLWQDKIKKNFYESECKKRAWPAHLEQLLSDTDVINCSAPGISNEEIVHRAIDNFCNLKNNYKSNNISIIIMVTSYNRMGYPMYDVNYKNEYNYASWTSHHFENKISPSFMENDVFNFFSKMKDYDRLVKSISVLSLAKLFFETNGCSIHFVDSCLWKNELTKFNFEYKEKLQFYKKIIPIILEMANLSPEYVLPNYHFTEKTHKEFAEQISKLI